MLTLGRGGSALTLDGSGQQTVNADPGLGLFRPWTPANAFGRGTSLQPRLRGEAVPPPLVFGDRELCPLDPGPTSNLSDLSLLSGVLSETKTEPLPAGRGGPLEPSV